MEILCYVEKFPTEVFSRKQRTEHSEEQEKNPYMLELLMGESCVE